MLPPPLSSLPPSTPLPWNPCAAAPSRLAPCQPRHQGLSFPPPEIVHLGWPYIRAFLGEGSRTGFVEEPVLTIVVLGPAGEPLRGTLTDDLGQSAREGTWS